MTQNFNWDTGGGEGGTPPIGREIIAGNGLTGGGDLSEDVTLDVGAGDGITVGLDSITVKLASTSGLSLAGGDLQLDDSIAGSGLAIGSKVLSVNVGNGIEISSDAVSVKLATTSGLQFSSGDLQINDTIAGNGLSITNKILAVGAGTLMTVAADAIGLSNGTAQYQVPMTGATPFTPAYSLASDDPQTAEGVLLRSGKDGILTLVELDVDTIKDRSGNLTLNPGGDIILSPTGLDVLPNEGYTVKLGLLTKKFLELHAAELWVETLVAQNTIATIGGRILVAPTNILIKDLPNAAFTPNNNSFETAGGGGADVFANWSEAAGSGTIVRATGGYSGTYCAQLTCGTGTYPVITSDTVTVGPNRSYTLRFYAKAPNLSYLGYYRVYDVSNGADIIPWTLMKADSINVYLKNEDTFIAPSGCYGINIQFRSPLTNTYSSSFDLVTLETTSMYLKYNNFAANDIVYMEANSSVEWMRIESNGVSSGGGWQYYVTRNLDGSGLNYWYAGDAVVNTGVSGDGYIDLYSVSSVRSGSHIGPTIVGNIRTGSGYSNLIEAWAIGNLNGIYGYSSDVYGAGFGKFANSNSYITITSEATTGGIKMKYKNMVGTEVTTAWWKLDGTLLIGQEAASQGNILISSGAINLRVNTTVNMSMSTAGVLTVGATTGPHVVIDSGGIDFNSSSGNSWMLVDTTNSNLLFGLPRRGALNSTGFRVGSMTGFEGKFIVTNDIDGTGSGAIELSGGIGSSGEFYGSLAMPAFNLDAASFNQLSIKANAVYGTLTPQELLMVSNGTLANSYTKLLFNAIERISILSTETVINESQGDYNFRIESDTNGNMFVVDAGLNAVGIGGVPVSGYELTLTGDFRFSGGIYSYLNSQLHTGSIYVPLSSYWTSTSFDGNETFSTTGTVGIDVSTVFTSVPVTTTGIKAYDVQIICWDTGTVHTNDLAVSVGTSALPYYVSARPIGGSLKAQGSGIVPADANGDFSYRVTASGTNTMYIHLRINGYFI